ncbi:MAG: aminopeptidase [Candidatus Latescibacterota bacterium]|nr:aminopeptidase [Candidatus Latescibacterota bacterium]
MFLLYGCGDLEFGYYAHLAWGQARVLWSSRPVGDVLDAPSTSPELRIVLVRVDDIHRFALENLGFGEEPEDNYTRYYDTGGQPISWNVSASLVDAFEPYRWKFPLVGSLPYKGFFSKERASEEYERLRERGLDAVLRPVSAYSTLGYFSDPILSTMARYQEGQLADLILHELTHSIIYVEHHTGYNESVASFVGRAGALEYLTHRYGEFSQQFTQAEQRRRESDRFREFVRAVTDSLDRLYQFELPRQVVLRKRRAIFQRAQARFRQRLTEDFPGGHYNGFLNWKVNNAQLLAYRRYNRSLGDFEAVYRVKGRRLRDAIPVFVFCSEQDEPFSCIADSGDAD